MQILLSSLSISFKIVGKRSVVRWSAAPYWTPFAKRHIKSRTCSTTSQYNQQPKKISL